MKVGEFARCARREIVEIDLLRAAVAIGNVRDRLSIRRPRWSFVLLRAFADALRRSAARRDQIDRALANVGRHVDRREVVGDRASVRRELRRTDTTNGHQVVERDGLGALRERGGRGE